MHLLQKMYVARVLRVVTNIADNMAWRFNEKHDCMFSQTRQGSYRDLAFLLRGLIDYAPFKWEEAIHEDIHSALEKAALCVKQSWKVREVFQCTLPRFPPERIAVSNLMDKWLHSALTTIQVSSLGDCQLFSEQVLPSWYFEVDEDDYFDEESDYLWNTLNLSSFKLYTGEDVVNVVNNLGWPSKEVGFSTWCQTVASAIWKEVSDPFTANTDLDMLTRCVGYLMFCLESELQEMHPYVSEEEINGFLDAVFNLNSKLVKLETVFDQWQYLQALKVRFLVKEDSASFDFTEQMTLFCTTVAPLLFTIQKELS
jgi:hypothetical protein